MAKESRSRASSIPFDKLRSWRVVWTHDKRPGIVLSPAEGSRVSSGSRPRRSLLRLGRRPMRPTELFIAFRSARDGAFTSAVGALRRASIHQDPDEYRVFDEPRSERIRHSRGVPMAAAPQERGWMRRLLSWYADVLSPRRRRARGVPGDRSDLA